MRWRGQAERWTASHFRGRLRGPSHFVLTSFSLRSHLPLSASGGVSALAVLRVGCSRFDSSDSSEGTAELIRRRQRRNRSVPASASAPHPPLSAIDRSNLSPRPLPSHLILSRSLQRPCPTITIICEELLAQRRSAASTAFIACPLTHSSSLGAPSRMACSCSRALTSPLRTPTPPSLLPPSPLPSPSPPHLSLPLS